MHRGFFFGSKIFPFKQLDLESLLVFDVIRN